MTLARSGPAANAFFHPHFPRQPRSGTRTAPWSKFTNWHEAHPSSSSPGYLTNIRRSRKLQSLAQKLASRKGGSAGLLAVLPHFLCFTRPNPVIRDHSRRFPGCVADRAKSRVTRIRSGIRSRSVLRAVKRTVLAESIGAWPRNPSPSSIISLARWSCRHPSRQLTNMQQLMSDQ